MKRLMLLAFLPLAALAQWGNPPVSGYSALNTFLQSLIATQTGTGAPAGSCTPGKDVYLNTATTPGTLYYCDAASSHWTAIQAALGFTPENAANKDAVSGYAGLDSSGKLKTAEAPTWNQDTTGKAAGLSAAYIDWLAASGGAAILNKPALPANTGSVAHQFFTAYNATTGAFTPAQPQFIDIGGQAQAAQLPGNGVININSVPCTVGATCTITAGIVNLTIGNGSTPDPNAGGITGAAPSATNMSYYMDNGGTQLWWAYATNKWMVFQSSIGSGPYTISGVTGTVTTGLAASRPACSSNSIYFSSDTKVLSQCSAVTSQWATLNGSGQLGVVFDATAGTIQAYDNAGHITTLVRPVDCTGTGHILKIDSTGVPTCSADAGGSYPAAGIPQSTGTAWGSSLTLDTDGAMAANSNTRVPSQAAAKAYTDAGLAGKAASNAATTVNGQACTLGSSCTVPLANQVVAVGGTSQTARNRINLIAGSNVTITPSDNAGSNSTDITIAASGSGSTGVGRATLSATWTAINDGACQEQTATWTGITTGDTVILGAPASLASGVVANGRVSAANTVAIRLCNISGAAVTPGALTFNGTLAIYNLNGSGTIDFTSIPDGTCQANTFTLTGVSAGDPLAAQWPSSLESGLVGSMLASASNTVQVRLCNWSGAALDPASNTFGASVAK